MIYTDRGVYRPGETVHLRAIVRGRDNSTPPAFPVQWQIRRPDLRGWKTDMATLDGDGAAGMELQLPDDLPTGRWTVTFGFPAERAGSAASFGSSGFQVEEFRAQSPARDR